MSGNLEVNELLADIRAYLEYLGYAGVAELPASYSRAASGMPSRQGTARPIPAPAAAETSPSRSEVVSGVPRFRVGAQSVSSSLESAPGRPVLTSGRFGPTSLERLGLPPEAMTRASGTERSLEPRTNREVSDRAVASGPSYTSVASNDERVSSGRRSGEKDESTPVGHGHPEHTGGTWESQSPFETVEDDDPGSGQTSLLSAVVRRRPMIEETPDAPFASSLPADRDVALSMIREELGNCTRCALASDRSTIVFGTGNPQAEVVLVGGAPTSEDEARGLPFVGESGQLLDRIIETMLNLRREDVYLATAVMCRPAGQRQPLPEEIATCGEFLKRQIEVVRPRIIVALGALATYALLRTPAPLVKVRGHWYRFHGISVMPTFHPSALLADSSKKRPVRDDMLQVRAALERRPLP